MQSSVHIRNTRKRHLFLLCKQWIVHASNRIFPSVQWNKLMAFHFHLTFSVRNEQSNEMSFQRSYSRVYYGSDEMKLPLVIAVAAAPNAYYHHPPIRSHQNMSNIAEESMSFERHARPGSLRSHDSGFNDNDQSPNTSSSSSQLLAGNASPVNDRQTSNQNNNNAERSPSICSEATKTPPTVIRKKLSTLLISPSVRRISFSAPNSPDANKSNRMNDSFQSLNSVSSKSEKNSSTNSSSPLNESRSGSKSLRRSKVISPHNNSSYRRRHLLSCVSRVSDSVGDVYTLAAESSLLVAGQRKKMERNELHHSYESLSGLSRFVQQMKIESNYNNETVVFACGDDGVASVEEKSKSPREKLPLPSYDELYPPNSSSTPKMAKSKNIETVNHSHCSTTVIKSSSKDDKANNVLHDSDWNLSLSATMNWETCTYIEYTNPQLNGHASSVQFWLDEIRSTYAHEILSTLQTKSVLSEAARTFSMNPAIASKLINQIQIKAIEIETSFEKIERIFELHTKRLKRYERASEDDIEIASNNFKEIVSKQMKQMTTNVCQFMRKLNSKIIFKSYSAVGSGKRELKHFEKNVKMVIEMCQDLRVACDTKIDDIEVNCLLKDLLSLKQSILKTIRKVFRRLVSVIASSIESTGQELLLRAYMNMIATLPAEGVYNSTERFSSLNDAFLSCGIIRIHLLICIDSAKMSIRALALRALATICASSEMIQHFMEIGGLDVVTDIITDDKRNNLTYEPELREAVSVLTQVTAPWHHNTNCTNIIDLLKLSVDNLVTRLTSVLATTECTQTLMLCIACLNNLSRKSTLTFYSLMANQTIHRIVQACDKHQQCPANFDFNASVIFLYVSWRYLPVALPLSHCPSNSNSYFDSQQSIHTQFHNLIFSSMKQEQITGMLFNMAGNKKCHQHLVHKEIIYFLTFIFQTQFHVKYTNWTESDALKKTVKNILHIFARLIHHSAMGHDLLENNVIPIFSRVEQHFDVDRTYAKDLMYINKKLNNSFGRSSLKQIMNNYMYCDANNNDSSVCNTISITTEHSERNADAAIQSNEKRQLSACNVTGSTVLESYVWVDEKPGHSRPSCEHIQVFVNFLILVELKWNREAINI